MAGRVKVERRRPPVRSALLVASLLALSCGESQTPPLVPIVPPPSATVPPAEPPPQAASSASLSASAAPSSSPPSPDSPAPTVLRIADFLARLPAPGTYVVQ